MHIIGIVPAPTKATAVYDGERFVFWDALDVPARVAELAEAHPDLLVAWDAPMGLDPGPSHFYSRRVDKAGKRLVKRWVAEGRVVNKCIGIADAASCPHNLLTQASLGLPVGGPTPPWRLLGTEDPLPTEGRWLVEVHPAVALGAWWPSPEPMPRYKPGGGIRISSVREARVGVVTWLQRDHGFPAGDPRNFTDDHVDAWVAWRLAAKLLTGEVVRWGPADGAYYLMPDSQRWPG